MQDEITRRRWEMRKCPQDFKPVEALKAMITDIENGDLDPEHIVIIHSSNLDDDNRITGYYQAGKLDRLGSMGLVAQGLQIMGEKQ